MAVKKKKSSKWIIILTSILVTITLAFLAWKSYVSVEEFLFSENERFAIETVTVKSPGWWNGKSDLITQRFNITLGKTNMFSLNPADIRQTLSCDPSIKNVSVVRELPNALHIAIEERIPRARLLTRDTRKVRKKTASGKYAVVYDYEWVVDESGIVMSIDSCLNLSQGLPVIDYRFSMDKINKGVSIKKIEPALELIMLVIRKHNRILKKPQISLELSEIKFADNKSLKFRISLREYNRTYIVESMPYDKLDEHMLTLRKAILGELKNRNYMPKVRFDISGQVIWSR